MLLTGEAIKANYAKDIGLINDHFPKSKINKEVLKVAKNIASKSNLTIKIGKNARIGTHSTIMPGVEIGENAIIGAHSFVKNNVPANITVFGVPAK